MTLNVSSIFRYYRMCIKIYQRSYIMKNQKTKYHQTRNITPLKEHDRSLYFVYQLITALRKKQNAPITPTRFANLLNAWIPKERSYYVPKETSKTNISCYSRLNYNRSNAVRPSRHNLEMSVFLNVENSYFWERLRLVAS